MGIWRVFENCLEGVWWLYEWCIIGVWRVPGACLKGVWSVSIGCPNDNLVILDWCSQDRSSKSKSRSSHDRLSQDK